MTANTPGGVPWYDPPLLHPASRQTRGDGVCSTDLEEAILPKWQVFNALALDISPSVADLLSKTQIARWKQAWPCLGGAKSTSYSIQNSEEPGFRG